MIVDLPAVKAHLNFTLDIDDDLITSKLTAAQNHVENLLGFKIEETFGGTDQDPVPDALKEAVCQLAAHWYENREAAVVSNAMSIAVAELPIGMLDIIAEYRDWCFG